ncbi:hypothetical protein C0Z18_02660 [Trinickia dabaoshanensis]|uniref:Uncharacterized protein n=1 Tax=Trinickia dabaoshanensis TaxID=564714 RepID=A0A2N7W184_9BURK|nr:hypothetical protein [Trinickia dabaoshanensis]PMS23133.1 hypothetical protein C0Z18_02660 [Trinickia dabaoshanensis]
MSLKIVQKVKSMRRLAQTASGGPPGNTDWSWPDPLPKNDVAIARREGNGGDPRPFNPLPAHFLHRRRKNGNER